MASSDTRSAWDAGYRNTDAFVEETLKELYPPEGYAWVNIGSPLSKKRLGVRSSDPWCMYWTGRFWVKDWTVDTESVKPTWCPMVRRLEVAVASPPKWSCGHRREDTATYCPICAAFGRPRVTT